MTILAFVWLLLHLLHTKVSCDGSQTYRNSYSSPFRWQTFLLVPYKNPSHHDVPIHHLSHQRPSTSETEYHQRPAPRLRQSKEHKASRRQREMNYPQLLSILISYFFLCIVREASVF